MDKTSTDELAQKTILIVDDDHDTLDMLEQAFRLTGSRILKAANGSEALHQFHAHYPDLVLLDIMMPNLDGITVCGLIRQVSTVPIILISALNQTKQIVHGLETCADDYITKPFAIEELLARARVALWRAATPPISPSSTIYNDDYLVIDAHKRRVLVEGQPVKLSNTEFRLLTYLAERKGRVLTFEQILVEVWGWEYQDHLNYVHTYISRLRQKVEEEPHNPRYLITQHGVGYRFQDNSF